MITSLAFKGIAGGAAVYTFICFFTVMHTAMAQATAAVF